MASIPGRTEFTLTRRQGVPEGDLRTLVLTFNLLGMQHDAAMLSIPVRPEDIRALAAEINDKLRELSGVDPPCAGQCR